MTSQEAIKLVVERKAPHKDWVANNGLYANLSHWPNAVEYYVECPKCHKVHGDYATMKEAHDRRLCSDCDVKAINDIKKEVRQVVLEPDKKVRPLASIVGEAEEPPSAGNADDAFLGRDPADELDRMLFADWTFAARWDLANELNYSIDDVVIDTADYAAGDYDANDPCDTTFFTIAAGAQKWLLFKDFDTANNYAKKIVRQDLEQEPEIFSADWIRQFIDTEALAQAIGDPYEDHGQEERDLDYEDKLNRMVEENEIESDDPVFFKEDGEPRRANNAREEQLDSILEKWIEETKPEFDPWEYLEDCYGKDDVVKQALELVKIDTEKAAESTVNEDGWEHFVARYDNNSVELKNGALAARLD